MQSDTAIDHRHRAAVAVGLLRRFRGLVLLGWVVVAVVCNVTVPWWRLPATAVGSGWPHVTDRETAGQVAEAFPGTGIANEVAVVVEGRTVTGHVADAYVRTLATKLRTETHAVQAATDMGEDSLTAPVAISDDRRARYLRVWVAGKGGSADAAALATVAQVVREVAPPPGTSAYLGGPAASAAAAQAVSEGHASILVAIMVALACVLLILVVMGVRRHACAVLLLAALGAAVGLPVSALITQTGCAPDGVALSIAFAVGASVGSAELLGKVDRPGRRVGTDPLAANKVASPRVAAGLIGAAGIVILTAVVPGWLGVTGMSAAVSAAGLSAVFVSMLTLSLTPGWGDLLRFRGARRPRTAPTAVMTLYRIMFRRPVPTLAGLVGLALSGVFVLTTTPISLRVPAIGPPKVFDDAGDIVAARHFPDNRLWPDTVIVTGRRDLRNPPGLIAIDQITRALMNLPGVTRVQSPTAPGGTPWPQATLAHQFGELNQQLQAGGTSSGPLSSAITNLPDSIAQVDEALSQVQSDIDHATSGLATLNRSLSAVRSSVAEFDQTTMTLANYAEPLRRFTSNFADCSLDTLCAGAAKILGPVDSIRSGMSGLKASTAQLQNAMDTAAVSMTSATHAVAELKNTVAQLKITADSLASTARIMTPKLTQMSALINVMADDLSKNGAGGFYLPMTAIDGGPYKHVKGSLFSTDGRSVRIFVYSTAATPAAPLAIGINKTLDTAAKFGALSDRKFTVIGPASAAHASETQWHQGLLPLLLCGMVLLAAGGFLVSGSWRLSVAASVVTLASYLFGLGMCVAWWTYLSHIAVGATVPLTSAAIVLAGAGVDACGVMRSAIAGGQSHAPRVSVSGTSVVPVGVWALCAAMLIPREVTLSQVAAVTATAVLVCFGAVRATAAALRGLASRPANPTLARPVQG